MAKKRAIRMIDGCVDEIVYVHSELWAACYQGMLYWKNRSPIDIVRRRHQINRLGNRMDMMQPHVRVVRRRRA